MSDELALSDPGKDALLALIAAAGKQGRHALAKTLASILASIERLERELERRDAAARAGLVARLNAQTPERRREIAALAARRRWSCERTASEDAEPLPFVHHELARE